MVVAAAGLAGEAEEDGPGLPDLDDAFDGAFDAELEALAREPYALAYTPDGQEIDLRPPILKMTARTRRGRGGPAGGC